jgi:peptidoglycan hydrolase-like protein with peptidoglycan-binding domain
MEPPRVEEPHEAAIETWVPDAAVSSDTDSPSTASNTRRRRRLAAGGAVLLAAAAVAVVVFVVLRQSHSSAHNTTGTGVPAGDTTAEVTRRTLTESSTIDGTLGYGGTLELYDRVSGTFTWLPAVGVLIARGGTLWRVNNLPVALMYGSVPAYRTLEQGVGDGPDVVELNENLIDLGFDPYGAITDDEVFGEATAAAVKRWQKAEGLQETGKVELGRIVFAPGARRVTAVKVALGQDPPGSPAADTKEEPAGGTNGKPAGSKEPARKKYPAKKHSDKKEPAKESPSKNPSDKEPAPKEPTSKEPSKDGAEAGAGAGMVVLSTTSTQQLVQLKVKAEQQTLARVGQSSPVTLPGGDVVKGRIIEVGSVASSSSSSESEKEKGGGASPGGESESATIPVTLALEHPVAHLDEAPVSVELVKSVRRDVLAVAATALTATAGGGYAIETLENGRRVALAVTPGMFANGYVQVEGAGVHEGLTVIESE